jgi:puromycin-sensitive aminopeptidase
VPAKDKAPKRAATRTAKSTRKATRSAKLKTTAPHAEPAASAKRLGLRLSSTIRPLAYRIHIHVDPARDDSYRGEVEIDVECKEAFRRVELHAVDLVLQHAAIEQQGLHVPAAIEPHPERETIVLVSNAQHLSGGATLKLAFAGTLRTDLRGLYAARSGARTYAVSQLEAADARRFFPCFDEPAFKARFTLRVTTRRTHTVISNMPVAQQHDVGGDEKQVDFEPTPLLSTYLVALAVGELECSEPVYAGNVAIRLIHVPGNAHLTSFALQAARECLLRLSKYFALPYPYAKLDLVAVPDFEIGAMENAGAVFFRETLLLIDEATVSLP